MAVPRRIIIDCDPGVDDAVALLLAFAAPEAVEVAAITTVIGNVALTQTTTNALRIRDLAGRGAVPVYAGCRARSWRRWSGKPPSMAATGSAISACRAGKRGGARTCGGCDHPYGAGKSGCDHPLPDRPDDQYRPGADQGAGYRAADPRDRLHGRAAFRPGNSTPSAEFNFMIDPHAAQIMLTAGVPMTMFGLDVTAQAVITQGWMDRVEAKAGPTGRAGSP